MHRKSFAILRRPPAFTKSDRPLKPELHDERDFSKNGR